MILHWGLGTNNENEAAIRILLDTGSTVPLLSLAWVASTSIQVVKRATTKRIENFAGDAVPGAGEYYTSPLLLQHRKHYTREMFEVAPLAGDYDAILPAWWMAKHRPEDIHQGRLTFTSPHCRKHCTKSSCSEFSLEWDEDVLTHPDASVLGVVCAAPTENDLKAAIDRVPEAFAEFIPIMTTEAASTLPKH